MKHRSLTGMSETRILRVHTSHTGRSLVASGSKRGGPQYDSPLFIMELGVKNSQLRQQFWRILPYLTSYLS